LTFSKSLANAEIPKIVHQPSACNSPKSPPFGMISSALESAEVWKDDVHIKKRKGAFLKISKFG